MYLDKYYEYINDFVNKSWLLWLSTWDKELENAKILFPELINYTIEDVYERWGYGV